MSTRASRKASVPRVRRNPDEARRLILDAAERLFAVRGPDAVGLKDVAREAGVSHALVSHYFGTYASLVDAALERRATATRDAIFAALGDAAAEPDPGGMLERLWSWVSDPVTLRLAAWAVLTGRERGANFFPSRVQGLRLLADALEPRLRKRYPRLARGDLEFALASALAITFGYALLRPAIAASLARKQSANADNDFRQRAAEMLKAHLARS